MSDSRNPLKEKISVTKGILTIILVYALAFGMGFCGRPVSDAQPKKNTTMENYK